MSATPRALDALHTKVQQGGHEVPVACPCGWDADGHLVLLDEYQAQWPPIPKDNPEAWEHVHVNGAEDVDCSGHIDECGGCGQELDTSIVVLRVAEADGPHMELVRGSLPETPGMRVQRAVLRKQRSERALAGATAPRDVDPAVATFIADVDLLAEAIHDYKASQRKAVA